MSSELQSILESRAVHLDEYKEANANMRHFSNMRVGILTICLAVNGVLFKSSLEQTSRLLSYGFLFLGVCSAFYFLIFDRRITKLYMFYRSRAVELEWMLGMNLHKRHWPRILINATNATKVLYSTIILVWLILLADKERLIQLLG